MSMVAVPLVGAQEVPSSTAPPGATTSTTAVPTTIPEDGTTTTTPPPATTPPESTTTTTVPSAADPSLPAPSIPPELLGDPRAPILLDPSPDDGGEIPVAQAIFDPGTNQVLAAMVMEISAELESAKVALGELQVDFIEQQIAVDDLRSRLDAMGRQAQRNVAEAAAAERQLKDHTVEAFISGSSQEKLTLVRTSDPVQLGVARELLDSVVETDEEVVERYEVAKASLDAEQQRVSSELATAEDHLVDLEQLITATITDAAETAQALVAYQSGSQVYVKGFVFPVQGEVEFIDSWGYPRMTGTASAHWHQGTDIFAPRGTPLVAAESGELQRIGVASLGGNKLWVKGDSGTEYYYAHLVAFAAGIHDGMRVNAGDVVGYVGDTGNARGTPPHLHFEVHPNGGDAVNPYPLLKATYGTKPMVQIVSAPPPTSAPAATTDPLGALAPAPTAPTTTVPDPLSVAGAPGTSPGP
jgi:murein DD-endopeptidase MepM/ murein hydrolase activator NlpD